MKHDMDSYLDLSIPQQTLTAIIKEYAEQHDDVDWDEIKELFNVTEKKRVEGESKMKYSTPLERMLFTIMLIILAPVLVFWGIIEYIYNYIDKKFFDNDKPKIMKRGDIHSDWY